MTPLRILFSGMLVLTVFGCKEESKEKECAQLGDACDNDEICEYFEDGALHCAMPVIIAGTVTDSLNDAPIEGARVQARDANGTATGGGSVTDAAGRYEMPIPVVRDASGVPINAEVTLASQAQGYDLFPTAVRQALPIDVSTAVDDGRHALVVENAITQIKLMPLAGDTASYGSISGSLDGEDCAGVLLVAENENTGYVGFSDGECAYTIFNVPPGDYTVSGYAQGVQFTPTETNVSAGATVTATDIATSDAPLSTVRGSVNLVNAPGGSTTSVILAVESTFVEGTPLAQVPRGLRVGDVTGEFVFEGVPNGRYVVLAAYENDLLVRDPDTSIAGTDIVHIEVPSPDTGNAVVLPESFKVTEALAVVSPGADAPEQVTADGLTFVWADDSSEKNYSVQVIDAFGNLVWETTMDGVSGGTNASILYEGPALESGMYYQFKVTSINNADVPISTTEDLKGVFFL